MRLPVQAIGTARDDSANLRTVKACSRVTSGNHSRNWSTVAPPSRFSKSACTGTRVPLNTHAPLTLPGTRSTAAHFVQSDMHRKLRCRPDTGKREAHFRSSGSAARRKPNCSKALACRMREGGRLVSPKSDEGGRPGEGEDFDESLKHHLTTMKRSE